MTRAKTDSKQAGRSGSRYRLLTRQVGGRACKVLPERRSLLPLRLIFYLLVREGVGLLPTQLRRRWPSQMAALAHSVTFTL